MGTSALVGSTVLQLFCKDAGDGHVGLACISLNGEVVCTVMLPGCASITSAKAEIAQELAVPGIRLKLVLPGAVLLDSLPFSTQLKDLLTQESHYDRESCST